MNRVVVTGLGIISCIGNTKSDMYAGYSAGIKRNFLLSVDKKNITYNKRYIELNYKNLMSQLK